MEEFRASLSWPVNCAITGDEIALPNDLRIDHKVAFWRLLANFCSESQVVLPDLDVVGNGMAFELADLEVTKTFADYHLLHAQLQPTCRQVNVWKGGRVQ